MTPETETFRRLGPYALLQLSGAGGMGRVDVALTTRAGNLTRLCVLKRMHSDVHTQEEERRFRREAKIALRLSHGAIARTFDVEEIDGELCLLQEFVHGTNLAQLEHRAASREPLPVPLSIHIAREVARALAYAHSFDGTGIVHRDVTPDNIMLSFSGEVKLVDFGIAKSLGEPTLLTEVGAVVGRPIYTAPEIVAGGTASRRSDIYSLGVVLWQLLTGRSFPDPVLQGLPAAPSSANPAATPDLDQLVAKAIEPDPALRYEQADELQIALARLVPPGFVGDRALADFLAGHFPVETEKRALAEDISRAQAQLAAKTPAPTATTAADEGGRTKREPAPSPARRRRRLVPSTRVIGVAIAGAVVVAIYLRSQPDRRPVAPPDIPRQPHVAAQLPGTSAPQAVPVVRPAATTVPPAAPSPSADGGLDRAPRARAQSRPSRERAAAPTGADGSADLARQAEERLRGGDLKTAYAKARAAVRSGGGTQARMVLGKVLFAQSRLTLAEQEFAEIVRMDPGNAEAARYLANVRRELARGERP